MHEVDVLSNVMQSTNLIVQKVDKHVKILSLLVLLIYTKLLLTCNQTRLNIVTIFEKLTIDECIVKSIWFILELETVISNLRIEYIMRNMPLFTAKEVCDSVRVNVAEKFNFPKHFRFTQLVLDFFFFVFEMFSL